MTMTTIVQGQEIHPDSVDVLVAGAWVMGADLSKLPEGSVVTSVRRNFAVLGAHIYQYITEFIDVSSGGVKQVTSRVTVESANRISNQVNTVGALDSPLSVRLFDVSPAFPGSP